MEKEIKRFSQIYPWYAGFTGDLLFYIAVDTLFLTVVREFLAAQIVSLTSFSQFACIALQFPILFLIKRMGNTASTRTGAFFLLLSTVFITFGGNYYLVLPKIAIMAAGYIIVLFVRDPFRLYMQDVIFENTAKDQHQTLLALLEFGVKVGTAAMGLSFSAILLNHPMRLVMAISFVISVIEILLGIKLYAMVTAGKAEPACE